MSECMSERILSRPYPLYYFLYLTQVNVWEDSVGHILPTLSYIVNSLKIATSRDSRTFCILRHFVLNLSLHMRDRGNVYSRGYSTVTIEFLTKVVRFKQIRAFKTIKHIKWPYFLIPKFANVLKSIFNKKQITFWNFNLRLQ